MPYQLHNACVCDFFFYKSVCRKSIFLQCPCNQCKKHFPVAWNEVLYLLVLCCEGHTGASVMSRNRVVVMVRTVVTMTVVTMTVVTMTVVTVINNNNGNSQSTNPAAHSAEQANYNTHDEHQDRKCYQQFNKKLTHKVDVNKGSSRTM